MGGFYSTDGAAAVAQEAKRLKGRGRIALYPGLLENGIHRRRFVQRPRSRSRTCTATHFAPSETPVWTSTNETGKQKTRDLC